MDYVTMEVDIDHGKILPRGPTPLPDKASGLLTILPDAAKASSPAAFLGNLESLQKHLELNEDGAQKWMLAVRAARR